ncbi:transposase [Kocuria varians]|uniref:transposase n=1 Tax=Kocuria varians TaxID=1272 RepID=UPI000837AF69|nr:transposase [Kocuria varians]
MAAPRKYPDELRERATRMVLDLLEDDPGSQRGVFRRVGDQLGVNPETLRGWVRQTQIDAGTRPGTTTDDAQKIIELEKEVRELRRANAMADSSGERKELCELL